MLTKFAGLEHLWSTRSFLIVRMNDGARALQVARAAIAGGMRALEITYSVPGCLDIISRLREEYGDRVLIGAGTVTDAESAYAAVSAGAQLLVSPQLNPEMIKVANRYQTVSISGAFTPTEIYNTAEAGADMVKLFPAETVGPAYLKSVLAPLAHIPVAPTGAVNPDTVADWFAAGAACVGVGSYLSRAAAETEDWAKVTEATEIFLDAVRRASS